MARLQSTQGVQALINELPVQFRTGPIFATTALAGHQMMRNLIPKFMAPMPDLNNRVIVVQLLADIAQALQAYQG
jgi:hypothetical protein